MHCTRVRVTLVHSPFSMKTWSQPRDGIETHLVSTAKRCYCYFVGFSRPLLGFALWSPRRNLSQFASSLRTVPQLSSLMSEPQVSSSCHPLASEMVQIISHVRSVHCPISWISDSASRRSGEAAAINFLCVGERPLIAVDKDKKTLAWEF